MDYSETARRMAEIGREFHRRGWVLGTSGNFSAVVQRDPTRIAITESSADKGNLHPVQILQIDEQGVVLEPRGAKPSAETRIHLAVIRKTGAESVLHTHSIWSTLLSEWSSAEKGFPIEGYEMLKGLRGIDTHQHREWIPVIENSQDTAALAGEAVRLLSDNPSLHAFLIRRHGLYTWGRDIQEAARHVEILEFLMEAVWRSFEFQNNSAQSAAHSR